MSKVPFQLCSFAAEDVTDLTDEYIAWHAKMFGQKPPECWKDFPHFNRAAWKEIIFQFSNFIVPFSPPAVLTIDWTHVQTQLRGGRSIGYKNEISGFIETDLEADYCLEIIFHDLFLITNLSTPGCFSLYKSQLNCKSTYPVEFDLEGHNFSSAWYFSRESELVNIRQIPVAKTTKWYYDLGIRERQIAKTSVERALFAVLHYCNLDGYSFDVLLWLRYAIASLYDNASTQEIVSHLFDKHLIRLDKEETVQQCLNKLYKWTAQFLCGQVNIFHPLDNDSLDKELLDKDELMQVTRCSFAVIIATIQQHILEA